MLKYQHRYLTELKQVELSVIIKDKWMGVWIYDRNNKHPYWELAHIDEERNEIYGVCFDAEAFVYWLNRKKYAKRKRVARLIDMPVNPPKKRLRI